MTIAVAFPGQGAYSAEAARTLSEAFPQVADVYAEVDAGARVAGAAPISDLLMAAQPPSASEMVAESPESLQLAIYGVSVAIARLVFPQTDRSVVSFGHSLGEIAALQAGGAFTVSGGAEVVAHRARALRVVDGAGGMLALACDAQRARELLDVVGSADVSVAALNTPSQTVVSGPHADLGTVASVAAALRIASTALSSPYAFHNTRMAPVAVDFAIRLESVAVAPPSRPVYSPILGRYYENSDDIRSLLCRHLVAPVDFVSAVRQLRASGVTSMLECASASTLGALAVRSAEGLQSTTAALRGNERIAVEQARELLAAVDPTLTASSPTIVSHTHGSVARRAAMLAPTPVLTAAPSPTPAPSDRPLRMADRAELFAELAAMYAEALEYPAEVFTEDVALEAELGVDSVKQTELFARTVERYELTMPNEAVQLAQFDTMGKVVDLVWSLMSDVAPVPPHRVAVKQVVVTARPTREQTPSAPSLTMADRAELFAELAAIYAEALEYPAEVFTEDVALEAELGVDSVKQTELFARTVERYELPMPNEAVQLAQFDTMGKVVDLVWSLMAAGRTRSVPPVRSAA